MNSSLVINIPQDLDMVGITGNADENIRLLQDHFDARITIRGNEVSIEGDEVEVEQISSLFGDYIGICREDGAVSAEYVRKTLELSRASDLSPKVLREDVILKHKGRSIRPKTAHQKAYVDAIRQNTITFGVGPAGTGKTYLAMAMALSALQRKEVGRVILSRPIVEAGENLGFLPGTLTEKVDPYIRPLYDALFDMCDPEKATYYLETSVIEIAPLAFMRGRTLNDSFVILDEAQNTTPEQMKMFLTRLGIGSKMVITGDVTQIDISKGYSGLVQVRNILNGIDSIEFCDFSGKDVVRNSLVSDIISAYEKNSLKERQSHVGNDGDSDFGRAGV